MLYIERLTFEHTSGLGDTLGISLLLCTFSPNGLCSFGQWVKENSWRGCHLHVSLVFRFLNFIQRILFSPFFEQDN